MPPPPLMTLAQARTYAMQGMPIRLTDWTAANKGITWPVRVVTNNSTTDLFTLTDHGFALDHPLRITGDLPVVRVPSIDGLDASTIDLDGLDVYAVPASSSTFKLNIMPGFAQGILDVTTFSSSTCYVQRRTPREWLVYQRGFWWVIADGTIRLSRATDLTAAEFDATNWTTLTEDEFAAIDDNGGDRPPVIVSTGLGGGTVSVVDGDTGIEIDTGPGTATTVPAGAQIYSAAQAEAAQQSASSGGGSSASDGGSAAGAASSGSGGGAGNLILPSDQGAVGGGGSGGGAANSGADLGDDADDAGKASETPGISASILDQSEIIIAIDPLATGLGLYLLTGTFQVSLAALDYSTVKGSAFETYLVTLDYQGRRAWSRWMHAGETAQSFVQRLGIMLRGYETTSFQFKVRGPGGTKEDTINIPALDP